jgi:hypothetical protein
LSSFSANKNGLDTMSTVNSRYRPANSGILLLDIFNDNAFLCIFVYVMNFHLNRPNLKVSLLKTIADETCLVIRKAKSDEFYRLP